MIDYSEIERIEGRARITCIDGQVIIGTIVSVDLEDESGLGEAGISVMIDHGQFIEIGESEVRSIAADHPEGYCKTTLVQQ